MTRSCQATGTLWSDLLRALLLVCLVFQGVIGSAHLAFVAAAADDAATPFICSASGTIDTPGEGDPGNAKERAKRACPACAGALQAAGASLPGAAMVSVPSNLALRRVIAMADQWPQARQPASVNSRSPPPSPV